MSGKSLEDQARKKLTQSNFLDMFYYNDRSEQSAKLFKNAGRQYIVEKNFKGAIRCFKECGDIYKATNEKIDYLETLKLIVDSCSEGLTTNEMIEYRQKIADTYMTSDSVSALSNRNKQLIEIAFLLEIEERYDESLEYLNKCSEEKFEVMRLSEKKINLYLKLEKFQEAYIEYKKICDNQIKNHGITFAKKYIMMAIICAEIVSPELGKEVNDNYCFSKMDDKRSYLSSLEGKFTSELIESVSTFDKDRFETACGNYDRIIKFDPIQIDLLLKIKDKITGDAKIVNNENGEIDEPDFR